MINADQKTNDYSSDSDFMNIVFSDDNDTSNNDSSDSDNFKNLDKNCSSNLEAKNVLPKSDSDNKISVTPEIHKREKCVYQLVNTITLSSTKILKNNIVCSDLLYQYLRKILPEKSKITCVLIFKDDLKTAKTKRTFRTRAKCKQPECHLKFNFHGKINDQKTIIKVNSNQTLANLTIPLNYQLRGTERKKIQKTLTHVKPSTVYSQVINKMSKSLAKQEKNYQFGYSEAVLQKAKSEKLAENDKHSCDTADLILKMNENYENHPYIRHFFSPFTVYLATEEQIQLLCDKKDLVLHFDATGSIVRKPSPQSKRIYYYGGVVNINHKIYPMIEMITNDHTAESIVKCLNYFKSLWIMNKLTMPTFKYVVTDWSWASVNAIVSSWNDCKVLDYLFTAYDSIIRNQLLPQNITPVFFCYGHFMKMVSRHIATLKIKKSASTYYLEIISILAHCQTFGTLVDLLESFFYLLLFPKKDARVTKAMKCLVNITTVEINSDQLDDEDTEQSPYNNQFVNTVYQSSSFYNHVLPRYKNSKQRV